MMKASIKKLADATTLPKRARNNDPVREALRERVFEEETGFLQNSEVIAVRGCLHRFRRILQRKLLVDTKCTIPVVVKLLSRYYFAVVGEFLSSKGHKIPPVLVFRFIEHDGYLLKTGQFSPKAMLNPIRNVGEGCAVKMSGG